MCIWFVQNIETIVLPGVLEAFLRGNSRDLKKWFGEAAYSRINIAIRERKTEGLVMDPNVLSIDNVDVIEATVRRDEDVCFHACGHGYLRGEL